MNQNKYVFSQLIEFMDNNKFYRIVKKYSGDKGNRGFTCWNQMLMMIFGQLSNRESLRDLVTIIEAHSSKAYHLGFAKKVDISTIARANAKRNYKIYEEFATHMIDYARRIHADTEFDVKVEGNIYAFDSSTISLCLSVFWWATYKREKGAVKLHTLLDVKTQIPCFVLITAASVNDIKAMEYIPYERNSFYVFDRGYNSFGDLYRIQTLGAFFVFRARDNLKFRRIYSRPCDKKSIKCDQIGVFTTGKSPDLYPEKIRKIRYYDVDTNREFIFLTNNFDLTAGEIALLYKNRWKIELFFKWIKQHLKVKSFWGHTGNAVKIQLYCAIIAYCLVAIVGKKLKIERPIYTILQIVGFSLLDKTPVKELLTNTDYKNVKDLNDNLLLFN
jgi:FOG: Transposase and inactivated derivatives